MNTNNGIQLIMWRSLIGHMEDDRCDTVAVVDDDLAVLESLKFLLEVAGCKVATYASAVEFLDDRTASPSCLILDHHMPHMTGLELAARLRAKGVNLPILLITSLLSPAIVKRSRKLGIDRVVEKPPSETDLLAFVASCR